MRRRWEGWADEGIGKVVLCALLCLFCSSKHLSRYLFYLSFTRTASCQLDSMPCHAMPPLTWQSSLQHRAKPEECWVLCVPAGQHSSSNSVLSQQIKPDLQQLSSRRSQEKGDEVVTSWLEKRGETQVVFSSLQASFYRFCSAARSKQINPTQWIIRSNNKSTNWIRIKGKCSEEGY